MEYFLRKLNSSFAKDSIPCKNVIRAVLNYCLYSQNIITRPYNILYTLYIYIYIYISIEYIKVI